MALKRIKYTSRYSRPMEHAEVSSLAAQAQAKNARLGVTGILLTTGHIFYQVIEGPDAQVDALFHTISQDPRHLDVLVLSTELDITTRAFPNWAMEKVDLSAGAGERLEPLREIIATILESRQRADRLANTLERAILWELLGE